MTFYSLLRLYASIKSDRVRLLGLLALHLLRRRYIGIYLDPAMGCNLRCRMCFFSGEKDKLPKPGRMTSEQVEQLANALFHRALKLQVGCGAEPTLYRDLPQLVSKAKDKGVPYVSLTTNGQLLDTTLLENLAAAGLDEITLSMHGFTQEVYESFMPNAKFDVALRLLQDINTLRTRYPQLKLRINITINEDNLFELNAFANLASSVKVDILQVRPIQDLENSDYQNFSLQKIKEHYSEIFTPLLQFCNEHDITLLYPTLNDLTQLDAEKTESQPTANDMAREIQDLTYCYVSPGGCWKDDFDCSRDTFETYCRRTHRTRHILSLVFGRRRKALPRGRTKALNYHVK